MMKLIHCGYFITHIFTLHAADTTRLSVAIGVVNTNEHRFLTAALLGIRH